MSSFSEWNLLNNLLHDVLPLNHHETFENLFNH